MRRALLVLVLLGVGAWLIAEAIEGHGPLAWRESQHLRAMKDRADAPPRFEDMTIAEFAGLPTHRPLGEYSPLERRGVRVEGYARSIHRSVDGDFHLGIVPGRSEPAIRAAKALTIEITPAWRRGSSRWTYDGLARDLGIADSLRGGAPRPRVRISGWLMYDLWADALPDGFDWVFDRSHRISPWEIHPVTRIEVWDDARKAFVDVPR